MTEDGNEPLSYLQALALARAYAGEGEMIPRFWRDGSLWMVEYARTRPMKPEEVPSIEDFPDSAPDARENLLRAAERGELRVVVSRREEIVGRVQGQA